MLLRWALCGALLLILDTVSSIPSEDGSTNADATLWDVDVPDSLTVKKASRSSNVEKAIKLTDEQNQAITDKHNELRSIAEPTATNMRKMSWDDELAKLATDYSRKCIYEHNPDRKHSRFKYVGENIYISTGITMSTGQLTSAVWAWDNEKNDYDYETRYCIPGKKCGHYTQIVWDDTFKVGCGVTICYEVRVREKMWAHATLFVCNYAPGGNYDRHPFVAGVSCSSCSSGDTCEEKLCTNPLRDEPGKTALANWNAWSSWSTCSKTCLGGSAKRQRTCNTFVDSDCTGSAWELTFTCSDNLCDLVPNVPGGSGDSGFLPWKDWSSCSTTCGMGTVTRTRSCKPGRRCSGINILKSSCNKGDCGDFEPRTGWANWGPWQACSVTCGNGVQKRKRTCAKPTTCRGSKETKKRCRPGPCSAPEAARWSAWSRWSSCSATCGGGSRTKRRRCLTGSNCEGAETDIEACNSDRCPAKYSSWSNWEECSVTCGSGIRTRTRYCIGGTGCRGPNSDEQKCDTAKCPEYGPWSQWSDCDVTCGSGNRIRHRICASANKDDCEGEDTSAIACRMIDCTTSGWSPWSPWTRCSVTCGGGTKSKNRLCNVGNSGSKACPGSSVSRRRCKTNKCPEFTAWSEWSTCDATCGEGKKTRKRMCDTPTGNGCSGLRNDVAECKIIDCTKSKWKDWMPWSKCSASCGTGTQSRNRECDVGNTGPPCIGMNDEVKICNTQRCEKTTDKKDEKDPPNKGPDERNKLSGNSVTTKKPGGGATKIASQKIFLFAISFVVTLVMLSFDLDAFRL